MEICGIPFIEAIFHHDCYNVRGISALPCCGAWLNTAKAKLPVPVKEDAQHNIDVLGAWNSAEFKEFRRSVLKGTYEYCKKETCPHWCAGKLPEPPVEALPYIEKGETHLSYPPLLVRACIDKACNLTCPSCRSVRQRTPEIHSYERLISILSSGVKTIYINGSGELFINQPLLRALREFSYDKYPHIEQIDIITNGTAFNRTNWYSLPEDFLKLIREVIVSVDSPNKETYEKLRLGGSFPTTIKNLEFMSKLRRENRIKRFILTSVIQKDTILEMLDFTRLAITLNADALILNKIEYWDSRELSYFNKNMALPAGWEKTYKDIIDETKSLIDASGLGLLSNVISRKFQ
jgi:hypothetical protein